MKKVLFILFFLGILCRSSYSQTTLYDGWINFTSSYLEGDIYEYNYTWGANTTLSQVEIDNLFPCEAGPYMNDGLYRRTITGIGTDDFGFGLGWTNTVEVLYISSIDDGPELIENRTEIGSVFHGWGERAAWNQNRELTFRTRGNTGKQQIRVNIDYYAYYNLISGYDRPALCLTAGTPLQLTGNFTTIPEPGTLLLLGSGLLGLAGVARFRPKKKS
ncbi:MAG: PEP-CTERM sorting domain-containing protein [bacterium]|nr:PEP-CTERM sorting domain-containing protein [bacterium]